MSAIGICEFNFAASGIADGDSLAVFAKGSDGRTVVASAATPGQARIRNPGRIGRSSARPQEPATAQQAPVNNVIVRTALVSERKQLEALQWRASLNNPGDREALLANPDAIAIAEDQVAGGLMFAAQLDDKVVGFAAILPRSAGDFELDALFVEPGLQRHGIGRQLIAHCAQVARGRGAAAIHVVGNPHAEAFYRSCGFEMTGTERTRFGVGLLMRLTL